VAALDYWFGGGFGYGDGGFASVVEAGACCCIAELPPIRQPELRVACKPGKLKVGWGNELWLVLPSPCSARLDISATPHLGYRTGQPATMAVGYLVTPEPLFGGRQQHLSNVFISEKLSSHHIL